MVGNTRRVASTMFSRSLAGSEDIAMILPITWAPLFASVRISVSAASLDDVNMALIKVVAAAGSAVCVITSNQ